MTRPVETLPAIPARRPEAHKGDFGRVLVIAGSRGMAGAAVLSGRACLRGGAGLVTVATPASQQLIVACGSPCYMTIPLAEDGDGRLANDAVGPLLAEAGARDVVVVGPGCGQSAALASLAEGLLAGFSGALVLDADAINVLSPRALAAKRPAKGVVITPHPGEFARLTGSTIARVQAERETVAARLARETGVVVLLKGHGTVVTDGDRLRINQTGNPGMGTGGSGDVLSGLLGALLGQDMHAFEAATLAAHLHGLAGDIAAQDFTQPGLIASDLVDYLPAALARHARC